MQIPFLECIFTATTVVLYARLYAMTGLGEIVERHISWLVPVDAPISADPAHPNFSAL